MNNMPLSLVGGICMLAYEQALLHDSDIRHTILVMAPSRGAHVARGEACAYVRLGCANAQYAIVNIGSGARRSAASGMA